MDQRGTSVKSLFDSGQIQHYRLIQGMLYNMKNKAIRHSFVLKKTADLKQSKVLVMAKCDFPKVITFISKYEI